MKTTLQPAKLAAALFTAFTCIGADAAPEPEGQVAAEATAGEVASGMRHNELVKVRGIVSSVINDETDQRQNWFTLRTPSGSVYVSVSAKEHSLGKLLALTDAEVEVRALVVAHNRWKRFSGDFLKIEGKDCIRTLKPAPNIAPEFTGDPLDMQSFARRERDGEFLHKARIKGLLLTECRRFLFMQTADGQIVKLIMQTDAKRLKPGTMAAATGFVSYDNAGLIMRDGVLATLPDAPRPPQLETIETTLNDAHRRAKMTNGFSRRVVSLSGKTGNAPVTRHGGDVLWLTSDGNYAAVDISRFFHGMQNEREGTFFRVTGICDPEFETDTAVTTFPRFIGITIVPLPEDGVVVLNPSLLTYRALAFISINLLIIIVIVTVALVVQRIRYNRRGRQLLKEQVAHVRTKAKIDERTRLATELHDAVSQTLTGVALQIDSAEMANENGKPDAVAKFLATSRLTLGACRRELKDCLWDLKSRTFEEKDMTEAVNRTIAPHVGDAKTTVRFNVRRSRLSESKAHAVLSMVRELVVNAVRHGKARRIWIAGECSDGHISFSVRDDGCGFDPAAAPGPREGHFGLQGIRERVLDANGTIEINSAPDCGTKVTIVIAEEE